MRFRLSNKFNSRVSFSYSFRKRRRRARIILFFAFFGLLLALIIGAGLTINSTPQNKSRAPLPTLAISQIQEPTQTIPQITSPPGPTSTPVPFPTISLASLSPVPLNSQKWNWPANYYNPLFFKFVWDTLDNPVQNRIVTRGWTYGPASFGTFMEPFKESPQGLRLVQYWDKTRLEITDPSKPPGAPDYISGSSLVRELMNGEAQVGAKTFLALGPAKIPLVGDPQDFSNPALTYATLAPYASLKDDNRAEKLLEATVSTTFDKKGKPVKDPALAFYQIKIGYYSQDTGHNIPTIFWEFLNRTGPLYKDGNYQTARLFDWNTLAGFPLTEAYWTKTLEKGKLVDVLVQAFEKRILTYTPTNQAGLQVDWGDSGKQYFRWRY